LDSRRSGDANEYGIRNGNRSDDPPRSINPFVRPLNHLKRCKAWLRLGNQERVRGREQPNVLGVKEVLERQPLSIGCHVEKLTSMNRGYQCLTCPDLCEGCCMSALGGNEEV